VKTARAAGLCALLAALLAAACGGSADDPGRPPAAASGERQGAAGAPTGAAAGTPPPTVLFLGDSLTAGLGLSEDEAYPARIAAALDQRGIAARVVNAGVSGDTTAGGLSRLGWLLRQRPAVVVVALGANDGLRGLPVEQTEANLRRIIEECRRHGARVLLTGMRLPPNYGGDYVRRFEAIFPRLARELGVPLEPFLLEGVAADPDLNQADGLHPDAEGQRRVAEHLLPYLLDVLGER
jgi:acyl-CoA thioesterase I